MKRTTVYYVKVLYCIVSLLVIGFRFSLCVEHDGNPCKSNREVHKSVCQPSYTLDSRYWISPGFSIRITQLTCTGMCVLTYAGK
jgi:hypothetical protein